MKPKSASYKKQTQSFTRKTKKKYKNSKQKKQKNAKPGRFQTQSKPHALCHIPRSFSPEPRSTREPGRAPFNTVTRQSGIHARGADLSSNRKAERQTGRLGLAHALAWTSWLDYVQEVSPCFSDDFQGWIDGWDGMDGWGWRCP